MLGTQQLDWLELADDYSLIRDRGRRHHSPALRISTVAASSPADSHLGNAAAELRFATPSGKAEFSARRAAGDPVPAIGATCKRRYPANAALARSVQHHHLWPDDCYRGVYGQRGALFIHPEDLAALGLQDGERVEIETPGTRWRGA